MFSRTPARRGFRRARNHKAKVVEMQAREELDSSVEGEYVFLFTAKRRASFWRVVSLAQQDSRLQA